MLKSDNGKAQNGPLPTWQDQNLGNCPFKEKRVVTDATGNIQSQKCEGPACALWLRQEARRDSPGACSLNAGGSRLIKQTGDLINLTIGQSEMIQQQRELLLGLQGSFTYLIKLTAKLGGESSRIEFEEILKMEKDAEAMFKRAEEENAKAGEAKS